MQTIRIGEGALGVGQTERAFNLSEVHILTPVSSGFGLLSGLGRKQKIYQLQVFVLEIQCVNQLPTIDPSSAMITDAFQISCVKIIC
jgi:hypothetical protein